MQGQSGKTSEIGKLKEYIQKIEPQLINYQGQIQQLVNELNQTKHNATIERNQMIEASRRELMEYADTRHNTILAEKEKETQGLKEKYSELEKQFNDLKEEYDYAGEQFDKRVNKAANNKAMMMTYEKDQEIQRLQEQINQLLSQQES